MRVLRPAASGEIVRLPYADLGGGTVGLTDLMSDAHYECAGSDLASKGRYVDLPPWGYHVFEMEPA